MERQRKDMKFSKDPKDVCYSHRERAKTIHIQVPYFVHETDLLGNVCRIC
jgi:hypothetical protein